MITVLKNQLKTHEISIDIFQKGGSPPYLPFPPFEVKVGLRTMLLLTAFWDTLTFYFLKGGKWVPFDPKLPQCESVDKVRHQKLNIIGLWFLTSELETLITLLVMEVLGCDFKIFEADTIRYNKILTKHSVPKNPSYITPLKKYKKV